MEDFLVGLVIFGSVGLVLWRWIEARHRERMAMIEKGLTPAASKELSLLERFRLNPLSNLKWGLLAMFVGMGLVLANWLDQTYRVHESVYVSSMLLFGGLALIIFYFIAAKKTKQEG